MAWAEQGDGCCASVCSTPVTLIVNVFGFPYTLTLAPALYHTCVNVCARAWTSSCISIYKCICISLSTSLTVNLSPSLREQLDFRHLFRGGRDHTQS